MRTSPPGKKLFGGIGISIGVLALAAAFLSPWIQERIDPPARPVEEVAVDMASRLASAAKAKIRGETYAPAYTPPPEPSRFLFPAVIGAGMAAVAFGALGALRSEDRFISGGAIAIGAGAAAVQWSLLLAGALMFIMLVLCVLSFLGVGP